MKESRIVSLDQAAEWCLDAVNEYPQRDLNAAYEAALEGRERLYPALALQYQDSSENTTGDKGVFELPEVGMPQTLEGDLTRQLVGCFAPLEMLNPFVFVARLGEPRSPENLITCFGIPLNPETAYSPAFHKSMDQVLAEGMPDPRATGVMPEVYRQIELLKSCTPDDVKIARFDTQGPFNIAHSMVGGEIMMAPYLDPGKFHELMSQLTGFWIESLRVLIEWIGPERQWCEDRYTWLRECSTNLISSEMYKEFVLPYDLRIAEAFGLPMRIHPCSGPHVFHQTLELLPDVRVTEAGYIDEKTTAAGCTLLEEALEAIGDRSVMVRIESEVPAGDEFGFIKKQLDRYETNKHLTFRYTGMHWRHKDRPLIRELHQRLDEYWAGKYAEQSWTGIGKGFGK